MTTHISDELPRLLTGDATRDVVLAASAHLRICPDCQQELVSAVVAHASLTSAHRFAPEIVARGSDLLGGADDAEDADPTPLPDMSQMFAKVRTEASVAPTRSAAPRRQRLLAVAAVAAVLTGGGITYAVTSGSGTTQVASRSISLAAFDKGHAPAAVTIVGDSKLQVNATALPRLDKQHRYEVWLTDLGRTKMQSIGFIDNGNTADINVPSNVMSHYKAIEVSLQDIDQDTYSGTSVLRGTYG